MYVAEKRHHICNSKQTMNVYEFVLLISWVHLMCLLHYGQVCTGKMNLSDEVDLEDYVSRPDKISAAEIAAICQEAGLHAVRKNR